ncbi:hypothetical protein HMPREF0063_12686 [Aeromicrobium marinum DSM 15272]|uniref:SLH domain-containing protein n=1 Tax=Aeromicrobium marinum DSM 15272 TaxID=585531 RepID=E2SF77_9ACTN|nr:S-layer homology domain-containing protein [Aeromicrobium marinum]EFQ82162.1 hypothetical protein HMPREF0063_12686 [Aeromicrobium marinum DSM 15272]
MTRYGVARWVAVVLVAPVLVVTPAAGVEAPPEPPSLTSLPDGSLDYAAPQLADEPTTTVVGELEVAIVEPSPGEPGGAAYAIDSGDGLIPLDIELPEGTASGAEVTAELVESPELESARAGRPAGEVEVASATVESRVAAAATPAAKRAYVAISTQGSEPTNGAVEAAVDETMGWWLDEGDGAITTFTRPVATQTFSEACSTGNWPATVSAASALFPQVNFGNGSGNHLIIVGANCGGTGLGRFGDSLDDGGWTIATWSASVGVLTMIHEVGHNVGLEHAGITGCTGCNAEYGNVFSVMGLGLSFNFNGNPVFFTEPALGSAYREQLEVDGPGEISAWQRSGSAEATVVLSPRAGETGTRGVQVAAAGDVTYWVDYRDGTGRDEGTFYDTSFNFSSWGGMTFDAGVTIVRQAVPRGETTLRPDGNSAEWQAGQTFDDGTVRIEVQSIGGGTATVRVHDVVALGAPDTTAPVVAFSSPPTSVVQGSSPVFAFTVDDAGAEKECRVDLGPWGNCTAALSHTVNTSALSVGAHSVSVRATDGAGNVGSATANFQVTAVPDTTAPVVAFTNPPTTAVQGSSPVFAFTVDDGSAVKQCRVDLGPWGSCTAALSHTVNTSGLLVGAHSVSVRATDGAGNVGSATANFQVTAVPDTTAPVVAFTNPPTSVVQGSSPVFAFTVDDGSAVKQCRVDLGPWGSCTAALSHTVNTSALSVGAHSVSVRATDGAGNVGSATANFQVTAVPDTTAPVVAFSNPPTSVVQGSSPVFAFTVDDAGAEKECRVDNGAWTACTAALSHTVNTSALSVGAHSVSVRATDAALNVGSATANFQVTAVPDAPSFTDVSGNHIFRTEILWLASTGITTGYDNGNGTKRFEPSAPVLREQMAAFLYRFETMRNGEPVVDLPATSPFTDVPTTHVFYKQMVWLSEQGITTGYDNGNGTKRFEPSAPVLREQMAAFLYRFDEQGYEDSDGATFADVSPAFVFFDEIEWLASTGITTGYTDGGVVTFRGGQPVLREQMAAFLYRYDRLP